MSDPATALKILPTGRQILFVKGDRNIFTSADIEEVIKSVERRSGAFEDS